MFLDHYEDKKTTRTKFTPQEDQRLVELVHQFGEKSWKKIASIMKTRITHQCRERDTLTTLVLKFAMVPGMMNRISF